MQSILSHARTRFYFNCAFSDQNEQILPNKMTATTATDYPPSLCSIKYDTTTHMRHNLIPIRHLTG